MLLTGRMNECDRHQPVEKKSARAWRESDLKSDHDDVPCRGQAHRSRHRRERRARSARLRVTRTSREKSTAVSRRRRSAARHTWGRPLARGLPEKIIRGGCPLWSFCLGRVQGRGVRVEPRHATVKAVRAWRCRAGGGFRAADGKATVSAVDPVGALRPSLH
jgi:hypothetical protein